MSHQDLVLQALGMDNYDNALDLMKQIADEFITEQENEDKLNKEIDTLLDGVDFSDPCHLWIKMILLPHKLK